MTLRVCRLCAVAKAPSAFPIIARGKRGRKDTRRDRRCRECLLRIPVAALMMIHGGICALCGGEVDPRQASVDHIVPLSRGGTHEWANVQLAHRRCNVQRGAMLMSEWSTLRAGTLEGSGAKAK